MDSKDTQHDIELQEQLQGLRRQWEKFGERLDEMEQKMPAVPLRRSESHRTRLMRQSGLLAILSAVFTLWSVPLYHLRIFPLWLILALTVYFMVMCVLNAVFYMRLRDFDIARLNMVTALREVISLTSLRRQLQTGAISLMVPMICCMFYYLAINDISLIAGGVAGGLIGGAIGYYEDRKARRLLREMKEEFESPSVCGH